MALRIYNSLTERKEEFQPSDGEVKMYVCGPTVYDLSHLGHARSFVVFDIQRRYLEFLGHKVHHVQNFTDLDDNITKRAQREGMTPKAIADRYITEFLADMDRLKVRRAHEYPRVTEHIPGMIEATQTLLDAGFAYTRDGDVLFRAKKASAFGKLTHVDPWASIVAPATDAEGREDPLDFVIWRRSKPGEPSWPSPWGDGRPGWHVECYVMATRYLGPQLDLHGGGVDLKFPHHESECSISHAMTGRNFSRFWVHNNFITVKGGKMSKSLGNFVTIRAALRDHDFEVLRFFLLGKHYREPIDYSEAALGRAAKEHAEIAAAIRKVHALSEAGTPAQGRDKEFTLLAERVEEQFYRAMDNDFNTPLAVAPVLEMSRSINGARAIGPATAKQLLLYFCDFCSILGLCEDEVRQVAP